MANAGGFSVEKKSVPRVWVSSYYKWGVYCRYTSPGTEEVMTSMQETILSGQTPMPSSQGPSLLQESALFKEIKAKIQPSSCLEQLPQRRTDLKQLATVQHFLKDYILNC